MADVVMRIWFHETRLIDINVALRKGRKGDTFEDDENDCNHRQSSSEHVMFPF